MKDDPISQQVLGVGLTPLIPLPFIDVWIRTRFMREIYTRLGKDGGRELDEQALDLLTKQRLNVVVGCLVGAVWWPIRKFFRTFFYFLTVKECIDQVSESALRSEMVREAVATGLLPERAEEVRLAMDAAVKGFSGSPVWRVITRRAAHPVDLHREDPVAQVVAKVASYGGFAVAMEAFRTALDRLEQPQLEAAQDEEAPAADPPADTARDSADMETSEPATEEESRGSGDADDLTEEAEVAEEPA